MEIENTTPLVAFAVPQIDRDRLERTVILARAAWRLSADSIPEYLPEQPFFALVDEYYGEPKASSLRRATEICYAKSRTDIYFVDPRAVPPGGRESRTWPVHIRIGDLRSEFHVTGPRVWYRSHFGSWKLSAPGLSAYVDVRYERAFGGSWTEGENGAIFRENPVGVGFVSPRQLRDSREVEAPSVFDPHHPPRLPGEPCPTVGLTPISPSWEPRLKKAGTYDEAWLQNDWPNWPRDFDETFFNHAPPNLQYPGFITGGEEVSISGLGTDSPQKYRIPDIGRPVLHVYCLNGDAIELELHLDTMVFDLNQRTLDVIWRSSFLPRAQVFFSQLRITHPSVGRVKNNYDPNG